MNTIKLENWSVVYTDPYKPPEVQNPHLNGDAFGHPRFEDGRNITTSSIKREEDGCIITKSGSKYELGSVKQEYEDLYPDAKNRLLSSLKKFSN